MFNSVLFVTLNLNKYDLYFVFSFRKLCKYCKHATEYSVTDIYRNNKVFDNNVNILKFKYLKQIKLNVSNAVLLLDNLKYVKSLILVGTFYEDYKMFEQISNNITKLKIHGYVNFKHLNFKNLHYLEMKRYNIKLNFRYPNLYYYNGYGGYENVKFMNLHTFDIYLHLNLDISYMYSLYKLTTNIDTFTTDLNNFNLAEYDTDEYCTVDYNKISKMSHLNRLVINNDDGIIILKKIIIKTLILLNCFEVTDDDIKDMHLYKLIVYNCPKITMNNKQNIKIFKQYF